MTVHNSYLTYSFQKTEAKGIIGTCTTPVNLQHFNFCMIKFITLSCHTWCGSKVCKFICRSCTGSALLFDVAVTNKIKPCTMATCTICWLSRDVLIVVGWTALGWTALGWTALRWMCPGCPEDWSEVPGTWFTEKYSRTCKDFLFSEEAFRFFWKWHLPTTLENLPIRGRNHLIPAKLRNIYCFITSNLDPYLEQ